MKNNPALDESLRTVSALAFVSSSIAVSGAELSSGDVGLNNCPLFLNKGTKYRLLGILFCPFVLLLKATGGGFFTFDMGSGGRVNSALSGGGLNLA